MRLHDLEFDAGGHLTESYVNRGTKHTMSVPENVMHTAVPSMTGEASLYHIVATDDPAGLTWKG